jgi:hypothetical protein
MDLEEAGGAKFPRYDECRPGFRLGVAGRREGRRQALPAVRSCVAAWLRPSGSFDRTRNQGRALPESESGAPSRNSC